MNKICILGAGSWGTALAILLSHKFSHISIWGRPEDNVDLILSQRENTRFLPGIKIADNIFPTIDLQEALEEAGLIILAIPSQSMLLRCNPGLLVLQPCGSGNAGFHRLQSNPPSRLIP